MKILAIGDFHGVFPKSLKEKFSEVDLILCTGDYGDTSLLRELEFKNWDKFGEGKTLEDIVGKKKMKTLMKSVVNTEHNVANALRLFNKPIITIYGNSDTLDKDAKRYNLIGLESKFKKFNFKLLKNNYFKLNNLVIAGFSGYRGAMSKGLSKMDKKKENKLIKFNKQWDFRLKNLFNKISNYSNVLFLIHDPPYGFFDKVLNKYSPLNNKNVGDKYFLKYIKQYKPFLVISGHMHEYQGLKRLGKSTIIATGSAKEGKAVIIDINQHTGKINNIDFIGNRKT